MKVLIMGGGNLGYYLIRHLLEKGYTVELVEEDRKKCERIADELGITVVCGNGTDIETLAKLKAGSFDTFVAVAGKDEDNLIACEIVKKQFGVRKIISRSNNPNSISLMKKLGVDIAVNTTQIITHFMEHEIDNSSVQIVANIDHSSAFISEYSLPQNWSKSGTKLMELGVPEECLIIYVIRKGELSIPKGSTVLMAGDEVAALTVGNGAKKLKKLFEI